MRLVPKNIPKLYKKYGSIKKIWKAEFPENSWSTVQKTYQQAVAEGLMPAIRVGAKNKEQMKSPGAVIEEYKGRPKAIETKELPTPKRGVKRYLFTCAQNETEIFEPFWDNLLVLKEHYKAELHVARFVYLTNGVSAASDKRLQYERIPKEGDEDEKHMWWDERVGSYLSDERLEVAPGLVWCGEMNILPTAVRPLSGLEVYTGRRSGIFPHVKISMESVASSKHAPTKFNYTTGTVTMRKYIQRKAGLKAEFHHCYGATLVEVDSDGDWFVRQINSDSEGTIYDLDVKVEDGVLTTENRVEAITWADIHVAELEKWIALLCWGGGGIVDRLKPSHQFFHDVLHFKAQSHHEVKHPLTKYRRYLQGSTGVEEEVMRSGLFLNAAYRDFCQNVIVSSNHHDHLGRWLEEQDGRLDPENAEYWFKLNKRVYRRMREKVMTGSRTPINFLKEGLAATDFDVSKFNFLDQDEEYILCHDRAGGIECGMHGHLGPNGSRGSPRALAKLGRKANIGHVHSASIVDGVYVAGTFGELDPDWTTGPSSWSHTFIITYPNGKRTLVTLWNNKWRGE